MNIYISYSPKDAALFQLIRSRFEEKEFHVLAKGKGFDLFASLSARNKHRIDLSTMCMVLFSPNGKGSYVVHQEAGYMNMTGKDYFIVESNGSDFSLKECRFGRALPVLENEYLHDSWNVVRDILQHTLPDLNHDQFRMIFHTNLVTD